MNQLSDWVPGVTEESESEPEPEPEPESESDSDSESVESLAEDGTITVSSVQKPNYEQVLFPLQ